jgi:uncharacterized membrane protein
MNQQNRPGTTDSNESGLLAPLIKIGLGTRLRAWFFTGIIVTAPIGLTIYLTYIFVDFVDRNVATLLPDAYQPAKVLPFSVPGFGLIIAVIGLTLIGFLTTNILGRALIRLGEHLVARMPVVRGIYSSLKQIFETVFAQSSTAFRQVALIEYPRPGLWTVAFVTADKSGEIGRRLGNDLVGLYVPTTPNPTSGFLLYLPRRDLVLLDMNVEDAMKLVISGGVVMPQESTIARRIRPPS